MAPTVSFGIPMTAMIGAEDDAAPWSYADGTGYVNDLVVQAFEAVGWKIVLEVAPYARCKDDAVEGRIVACFTTSKTPELEATLQFPGVPVINVRAALFSMDSTSFKTCNTATWPTTPTVAFVRGYEYPKEIEVLRSAKLVREEIVSSEAVALKMLAADRVDIAIVNLDAIKSIETVTLQAGLRASDKNRLSKICEYGPMPGYLAFSRKHPDTGRLLSVFERGMALLQKRGDVTRLQKQWAIKSFNLEQTRHGRQRNP